MRRCTNGFSELLLDYINLDLSKEDRFKVETHVEECSPCQTELFLMRKIVDNLKYEKQGLLGGHIEGATLIEYQINRAAFSIDDILLIERHVNQCIVCAEWVRVSEEIRLALLEKVPKLSLEDKHMPLSKDTPYEDAEGLIEPSFKERRIYGQPWRNVHISGSSLITGALIIISIISWIRVVLLSWQSIGPVNPTSVPALTQSQEMSKAEPIEKGNLKEDNVRRRPAQGGIFGVLMASPSDQLKVLASELPVSQSYLREKLAANQPSIFNDKKVNYYSEAKLESTELPGIILKPYETRGWYASLYSMYEAIRLYAKSQTPKRTSQQIEAADYKNIDQSDTKGPIGTKGIIISFLIPIDINPQIRYDLTVIDKDGNFITTLKDIKSKDILGNFEITLPREELHSGIYILRVKEVNKATSKTISRYDFLYLIKA